MCKETVFIPLKNICLYKHMHAFCNVNINHKRFQMTTQQPHTFLTWTNQQPHAFSNDQPATTHIFKCEGIRSVTPNDIMKELIIIFSDPPVSRGGGISIITSYTVWTLKRQVYFYFQYCAYMKAYNLAQIAVQAITKSVNFVRALILAKLNRPNRPMQKSSNHGTIPVNSGST